VRVLATLTIFNSSTTCSANKQRCGGCRAEEQGPSSSGSTGRGAVGIAEAGGSSGAGGSEEHPTQRELDNLREWVLTQQWLQQQALGDAGGGAGGGIQGAGGGGGGTQQLQAMQQLWEPGAGRG
jgi:hypothetical protein